MSKAYRWRSLLLSLKMIFFAVLANDFYPFVEAARHVLRMQDPPKNRIVARLISEVTIERCVFQTPVQMECILHKNIANKIWKKIAVTDKPILFNFMNLPHVGLLKKSLFTLGNYYERSIWISPVNTYLYVAGSLGKDDPILPALREKLCWILAHEFSHALDEFRRDQWNRWYFENPFKISLGLAGWLLVIWEWIVFLLIFVYWIPLSSLAVVCVSGYLGMLGLCYCISYIPAIVCEYRANCMAETLPMRYPALFAQCFQISEPEPI